MKLFLTAIILMMFSQNVLAHESKNCLDQYSNDQNTITHILIDLDEATDRLVNDYSDQEIENILHMSGLGAVFHLEIYNSYAIAVNVLNPKTCKIILTYPVNE